MGFGWDGTEFEKVVWEREGVNVCKFRWRLSRWASGGRIGRQFRILHSKISDVAMESWNERRNSPHLFLPNVRWYGLLHACTFLCVILLPCSSMLIHFL